MGFATIRHGALHALHTLRWLPPLVARIALGVLFVSSGWGKVHMIDHVAQMFAGLGIPDAPFFARLVAGSELTCGALLLIGCLTRLATIPLITTMIVALATAKSGEVTSLPALFGLAELTNIVLLLYLAIGGPGAFAVDTGIAWLIERRAFVRRHRPAPTVPMAPLGHHA